MLLDLDRYGVTGKALEALLGQANITVNKNTIRKEKHSAVVTSGVRIGTPAAVTTRGMKEAEMKQIASLITRVIRGVSCLPEIKAQVLEICAKHPLYEDA